MPNSSPQKGILIILAAAAVITTVVYYSPIHSGDDWGIYYRAAWRILTGVPLYDQPIGFGYYYNPPWVAAALIPLALLPERLGWALISCVTLGAITAVAMHWQVGRLKLALILTCPATIYLLLHGQLDAILLATVFLPGAMWATMAFAKPQVTIGFLLGVPRSSWVRSGVIFAIVLAGSIAMFGNWMVQWIQMPRPMTLQDHNLWLHLWPYQIPVGIALLVMGACRRDEKWLIAGSPLIFPYAAMSSLIGPWLAGSTLLRSWQTFGIWLLWWVAVIFWGFGGGG